MNNGNPFGKILSYVMVAAIATMVTFGTMTYKDYQDRTKLDEIEDLIDMYYIGAPNRDEMEEAAAYALLEAMGDQWSYYMPPYNYVQYEEQMENSYVGIGVSVSLTEDRTGLEIQSLQAGGAAKQAGILPGDIIIAVEGEKVADIGINGATAKIRGEENTQVSLTILRGEETQEFLVTRRHIKTVVVSSRMLENNIGLVTIKNFNSRCCQESIAAIESLIDQGAEALIFDVRYNPGGYKTELVELLDYLLPEGVLFRSEDYSGATGIDYSDESCVNLPMAVLVNDNTYSAAEFFAAALVEYNWAFSCGSNTTGKSRFQNSFELSDGSAVVISVGRYLTPNGVDLAEAGGIQVDIPVEITDEEYVEIYAELIPAEEDPQIQAAVRALLDKNTEKLD